MSHEPNAVWTTDTASFEIAELKIIAMSMIAARKALHGPLPSELIHDAALDLLLYLFVAEAGQKQVAIEDLAAASTIYKAGAGRWISVLENYNLVQRQGEQARLSPYGLEIVCNTLKAVAQSQWQFSPSN